MLPIFFGNGNGFIMTNNGSPGTKIARMKLQTTASSFAEVPLLFEWRNQSPDPFTKIYAYINNLNINVSPNALFSIDTSGILSTVNIKVAVEGLYRTILNNI
ncbi:MAG: hypothetical protein IPM38_16110 [Ignavibacteria bacterium]|nr:hypothetical protein [Ignavibacteria bacterium]